MLKFTSNGVEVPLGVFTGIRLLQGYGKIINMQVIAINSVKCDVVSSFESAGINQTLHRLNMEVSIDVAVLVLGQTGSFTMTSEVVVAETVIVGAVPQTYLQTGG